MMAENSLLSTSPSQALHQGSIEIGSILDVDKLRDVWACSDFDAIAFGQGDLELAIDGENRRIVGMGFESDSRALRQYDWPIQTEMRANGDYQDVL